MPWAEKLAALCGSSDALPALKLLVTIPSLSELKSASRVFEIGGSLYLRTRSSLGFPFN